MKARIIANSQWTINLDGDEVALRWSCINQFGDNRLCNVAVRTPRLAVFILVTCCGILLLVYSLFENPRLTGEKHINWLLLLLQAYNEFLELFPAFYEMFIYHSATSSQHSMEKIILIFKLPIYTVKLRLKITFSEICNSVKWRHLLNRSQRSSAPFCSCQLATCRIANMQQIRSNRFKCEMNQIKLHSKYERFLVNEIRKLILNLRSIKTA